MHNKGNAQPEITLQQSARWLPADMDTPISLFMGMVGQDNGILLESAEVDGRWGRYSILACDAALFIACRDGNLELTVLDERLTGLRSLQAAPLCRPARAHADRGHHAAVQCARPAAHYPCPLRLSGLRHGRTVQPQAGPAYAARKRRTASLCCPPRSWFLTISTTAFAR